jgi:hypothetical protein
VQRKHKKKKMLRGVAKINPTLARAALRRGLATQPSAPKSDAPKSDAAKTDAAVASTDAAKTDVASPSDAAKTDAASSTDAAVASTDAAVASPEAAAAAAAAPTTAGAAVDFLGRIRDRIPFIRRKTPEEIAEREEALRRTRELLYADENALKDYKGPTVSMFRLEAFDTGRIDAVYGCVAGSVFVGGCGSVDCACVDHGCCCCFFFFFFLCFSFLFFLFLNSFAFPKMHVKKKHWSCYSLPLSSPLKKTKKSSRKKIHHNSPSKTPAMPSQQAQGRGCAAR